MSDQNPISLDAQLIARVRQFLQSTNIRQKQLAQAVGSDAGNFSAYLAGAKSLSVNKLQKLHQILCLNRMQLEVKFGAKPVSSHILELRENGQKVSLDNLGFVPGQSGSDQDGTGSIDDCPTARDLDGSDDYLEQIDAFLKDQQNVHRSAIAEIQKYLDSVQKAKVHNGPSEGMRRTSDNADSSKPGPRGDKFTTPEIKTDPKRLLVVLAEAKKEAEDELRLQQDIKEAWTGVNLP